MICGAWRLCQACEEDLSIDELLLQAGLPKDAFDKSCRVDVEWLAHSRQKAPLAFLNVIDKLVSFRVQHKDAKQWTPETIEVMVSPLKGDADDAMVWPVLPDSSASSRPEDWPGLDHPYDPSATPWPRGWPGPEHPSTLKPPTVYSHMSRENPIAYRIFLGAENLAKFGMLASNRKVNIDGKTWRVNYRYVIPFEALHWKEKVSNSGQPQGPPSADQPGG